MLNKRGSCICTLVLYRNCDFVPVFLTLWIYPYDFKTKHQFAPAPSSTPNGVKLCTKDMNVHAILPLVFMPNCDFALVWPRLGSSVSCRLYFHHRVDYYPRKQQIIYRYTAKKTVVAFIVGAFDAAWSKVEHKPVHSRNLVLQEGTSGCSPDIFQAISSPHQ